MVDHAKVSRIALLRHGASLLGFGIMVQGAPTLAQTDPTSPDAAISADGQELQVITVTARRREETLQEVPLTVTAISAEAIANKGVRDIGDVAKLTPGLFIDKGFVQQDVRPNIRGLPATRGRPPVGVLLDGIDISTESLATSGGGNLANLKLFDLERIEVVKGPQSALYGRVAFGGAINYITKDPNTQQVEGYLSGEAGTYGLFEARGAINMPVGDSFAVRVNGLYSYFNGFYDNEVTGKRIGGYRSSGGSIAAKYDAGTGIKLIARGSYSRDNFEPRAQYYIGGAQEVGLREAIPLPADVAGQKVGIIGAPQTTLASIGYVPKRGLIGKGIGTVNLSADPATDRDFPGTRVKTFIGSLRGEFDLNDNILLQTWTGFTDSRSKQNQDADFFGRKLTSVTQAGSTGLAEVPLGGGVTGLFNFDARTHTRQFSQEVRIGDQSGKPFRWAVGGLYWWEDVDQKLGSIFSFGFNVPGSSPPVPVNIYYNTKLQGGRAPAQDQGRTTKHYSAYATVDFDLTERLILSAEGRYGREDYDYLFNRGIGISTVAVNGIYPFVLTGAAFQASTSSTYFAPRVGINYEPSQDLLFYASYARGVKPAGLSQVQTPNPQDAAFGPEKLDSFELGFKSSLLDRRVTLNAAVFHMNYRDKQETALVPVPVTVNAQGNISVVRNVGGAKIDGLEVEMSALVTRGLNFSVAYTYLDARYTNYFLPTTSPIAIVLAGSCTILTVDTLKGCFVDLNGNRLEQSARHSAVASVNYRAQVTDDFDLLANADMQYRSRRYQENTNSFYFAPAANVNLQLGVESPKYTILAYVNNVFNNLSVQSAQTSGDALGFPPGGQSLTSYAPDKRQIGIRTRINF